MISRARAPKGSLLRLSHGQGPVDVSGVAEDQKEALRLAASEVETKTKKQKEPLRQLPLLEDLERAKGVGHVSRLSRSTVIRRKRKKQNQPLLLHQYKRSLFLHK